MVQLQGPVRRAAESAVRARWRRSCAYVDDCILSCGIIDCDAENSPARVDLKRALEVCETVPPGKRGRGSLVCAFRSAASTSLRPSRTHDGFDRTRVSEAAATARRLDPQIHAPSRALLSDSIGSGARARARQANQLQPASDAAQHDVDDLGHGGHDGQGGSSRHGLRRVRAGRADSTDRRLLRRTADSLTEITRRDSIADAVLDLEARQ